MAQLSFASQNHDKDGGERLVFIAEPVFHWIGLRWREERPWA